MILVYFHAKIGGKILKQKYFSFNLKMTKNYN